jgi:hypothetical protein
MTSKTILAAATGTSRVRAEVIEPRRTISDVVTFVGWVKEHVGRYEPAVMPEIATRWKILQSGFILCATEEEESIPTQECVN